MLCDWDKQRTIRQASRPGGSVSVPEPGRGCARYSQRVSTARLPPSVLVDRDLAASHLVSSALRTSLSTKTQSPIHHGSGSPVAQHGAGAHHTPRASAPSAVRSRLMGCHSHALSSLYTAEFTLSIPAVEGNCSECARSYWIWRLTFLHAVLCCAYGGSIFTLDPSRRTVAAVRVFGHLHTTIGHRRT